jgi:hypothetical protein
VPRKKRSKKPAIISEKTRAEDERLRQELAHADPEKFKRILKPLFDDRTLQARSDKRPSKEKSG